MRASEFVAEISDEQLQRYLDRAGRQVDARQERMARVRDRLNKGYEIYHAETPNRIVHRFEARTPQEAKRYYADYVDRYESDVDYDLRLRRATGIMESISNTMSTEDMIAYLRQHHDTNLHQDYLDHVNTNSKFILKDIPLSSISLGLSGLDRAKVEKYKKQDTTKAPPIVVGSDGYILDGYHRATAVKELGIPTIRAYVGVKGVAEGYARKLDFDKIYGKYLKITDNSGDPGKPGFSLVTPLNGDSWNWRERPEFIPLVKKKLNQPGWLGNHKYQQILDAMAGKQFDPAKHIATEDTEEYGGIQLRLDIEKDDEYVDDDDTDNQVIVVRAQSNGRELGQVLFTMDYDSQGLILNPQDLEVDERYRGQGIAQTMYDFVKSKGYRIRRSGQQTDAGAGFWDKYRPEQNVWENFADGKKPGRKGLSKRVGIPKKATLGQLEKIARSSTGEKRRMAQWQLNMRRGRAKKAK
jgi:GNAT superfamily N-acetyltransferase